MSALTIGIDAGPMMGRGGIHGYVEPLVRALVDEAPEDRYRLLVRRSWRNDPGVAGLARLAPVHTTRMPDSLWQAVWRHGLSPKLPPGFWPGLDLFLATCLVAPFWPQGKVVSIVYDMIPSRLPLIFPDHAAFEAQLKTVVGRSEMLVAISERTRRDFIELLGVPESRIRVVYPGRDAIFRPSAAEQVDVCLQHFGIEAPYFLYVGSLGPHKNVRTLLDAFARFRVAGGRERLVLVGGHTWGAELLAELAESPVREFVDLPGFVDDAELPHLYSGATGFIFPSFYEGFGFPVLEAMACGAPAITTSGGALPEVAGEAGIIVEPLDAAAMAGAMQRLSTDAVFRAARREAGLRQAERFSWQTSARQLAAILHEVGQ